VAACAKVGVIASGPPAGKWSPTAHLETDQTFAAVADLPGGNVLVAGGIGAKGTPTAAAEIFNASTDTWQAASSLPAPRAGAVTQVLPNHDVLVAGGVGAKNAVLSSALIYDPTTGTWAKTGAMPFSASFASSVTLQNGDVLAVGGTGADRVPLALATVYDPSTGVWTKVASMSTPRLFAATALLSNGEVLVAGGSARTALKTTEIFDTSTGTWSAAASLPRPSDGVSAVTLDSGLVLVVGDGNNALLYSSADNTWTQTGGSSAPWAFQHIVKMANGDVLAVGGESHQATSAQAELYIPTLGRWQNAGTLPEPSEGSAVALLSSGDVLVAGGAHAVGVSNGTVKAFTGDLASELFSYPAPWTGKASTGWPHVKPGSAAGFYIGGANDEWNLVVTQHEKAEGIYSGTITLNLGSYKKVLGVSLEKADHLSWKGGTIYFRFTNYGDIDAINFDVPAVASSITFNVELDGKPVSLGHVYLGRSPYGNPGSEPFTVDRA
jgi:N-acetylneuraminic acid mutarotase